jgi:transcription initiation factor TFIIIB Brf1 subunit/transcription initiation factor TFIIB
MISNIQEITECPDCASNNIVHNMEREQVICRECGLIFEPLTPQVEEAFERSHKIGTATARKPVKKTKAKPKPKRRK